MSKRVFHRAGAVALAIGLSQTAVAAPLAYDGFNYVAGENALDNQNGGVGFDDAWLTSGTNANKAAVASPGLTYTDAGGRVLDVVGNTAFIDSANAAAVGTTGSVTVTPFRTINTALDGVTGNTLYLSFLGQQTNSSVRFINLALFAGATEAVAVGHGTGTGGNNWGAFTGGVGTNGGSSTVSAEQLSLLVLRVDYNVDGGTNERVRLYVNPLLDAEPAVAAVDFSDRNVGAAIADLTRIRLGAGGSDATRTAAQALFDEIRLGTTYADVTPFSVVPEPGSIALAGLAAATLAGRRRRPR